MPDASERTKYMRDQGLLLVCDWAHQFISDAQSTPIRYIQNQKIQREHALEPAAGGLWLVAWALSDQVHDLRGSTSEYEPLMKYGVTRDDYFGEDNKFATGHGFADVNFTWHFVPYVAKGVIDQFMADGLLSAERAARMTLRDWATVIRTPWFKAIAHDMAFTESGTWGSKGMSEHDYTTDALCRRMAEILSIDNLKVFDTRLEIDPSSGQETLQASTTKVFHDALRDRMRRHNSAGCPGAWHAGVVSVASMNNPHGQHLAAQGWITYSDVNEEKRQVHFNQPITPIDQTIEAVAALFDEYDTSHGTPYMYNRDSAYVVHEHHLPVQPLVTVRYTSELNGG